MPFKIYSNFLSIVRRNIEYLNEVTSSNTTNIYLFNLNLNPDHPDHRDYQIKFHRDHLTLLGKSQNLLIPPIVDLRHQNPPIYDQGALGSCTANAAAACFQYSEKIKPSWMPSRLFIYYETRALMNTITQDSGATLRDTIKVLLTKGTPHETDWPYVISQFTTTPPDYIYNKAANNKIGLYARVNQTPSQIELALYNKFCIMCGILVYDNFYDSPKGDIMLPDFKSKLLGGHAIVMVGYNRNKKRFICRNSWGTSWGNKGYFTLPYQYILDPNLTWDFWVIKTTVTTATAHSIKKGSS